jgi:hypothetical protein
MTAISALPLNPASRHTLGRAFPKPQFLAACPARSARRILSAMGTKSRDRLYGGAVRMAAQMAAEARQEADKLACEAWTKRMLAFKGQAQPSPTRAIPSSQRLRISSLSNCATPDMIVSIRRPTDDVVSH